MTSHAVAPEAAYVESSERAVVARQVLGFWLYLMSDLILFAALFATYAVLRGNYAGGPDQAELFDLSRVFGETMLLLASSVTMGFAMLSGHAGRRNQLLWWLAVTFALGAAFVILEVIEFHGMVAAGAGPDRSGFLSAYFTLVATHGGHVTVGLIWLAVMAAQVATRGLSVPVRSRLLRASMFWHFLDLVWIGIFTLVYLMGVV